MILNTIMSGGFEMNIHGFYIIDFVVYVGALYWFLRKPVAAFVVARRERIMNDMDEAKKMRDDAQAQLEEYRNRLDGLEDEIAQLLEDARKAGEAQRERLMLEANRAAERVRTEATARLEQEGRILKSQLQVRSIELAMGVAEKIVSDQLTDAHRRRFVGDYISDVEARQGEL
ncbi:MAG: F-type H+-transporting ATPase subunit b [Myxococcota bacterium]|jgi:F-type H+-transporting ATPase subunit b